MKKRLLILFFALLLFLPAACAAEKPANRPQFHPPQTAAERALDAIFHAEKISEGEMNYFILKRPGYNRRKGETYSHFFTESLLDAWAKAGKKDIDEGCGGVYKGEICSIDFDVLTCAQDVPDAYFYRTIKTQDSKAIITYSWPEDQRDGSHYLMVKTGGGWKLDGVDCGEKYKFNITTSLREGGR
jgi:hypothetical protein